MNTAGCSPKRRPLIQQLRCLQTAAFDIYSPRRSRRAAFLGSGASDSVRLGPLEQQINKLETYCWNWYCDFFFFFLMLQWDHSHLEEALPDILSFNFSPDKHEKKSTSGWILKGLKKADTLRVSVWFIPLSLTLKHVMFFPNRNYPAWWTPADSLLLIKLNICFPTIFTF